MAFAPILEWRLPSNDYSQDVAVQDLGRRLEQRFRSSSYRAVQRIACEIRGGRLMLRGQIPEYLSSQVKELVAQEVEASHGCGKLLLKESN